MKVDFEKLDDLLLDRCWSMAELARQAGISDTTLTKLKKGINKSSSRVTVGKLAKALEVKPRELLVQE